MAIRSYPTTDDLAAALVGAGAATSNPVLTITTQFGAFPADTENYIPCVYSLTSVPGQADVYVTGRVRGRGNNTWQLPKKPLRVKLDDSAPLLGFPTSKDWALLANYNDQANTSNALAFGLGSLTSLPWSPRSGYVDLHFNGEYLGQYQLTETVDFGANRINATKATGTTGLPFTGAYSLEINGVGADAGKAYITTGHGVGVIMDDPDGIATPAHLAYMTTWLTSFEAALYGADFADPNAGFRAWIDTNTWIDWYLIEEFAGNLEGAYASSCKCVKRRDTLDVDGITVIPGKLFMGPLWDFDRSFGVADSAAVSSDSILTHTPLGAKWHARTFEDPIFRALVAPRWLALKAAMTAAGGVNKIIDRAVARVAPSQGRDAHRWARDYSYADLMATTKAYAAARMAFIDALYPA